MNMACGNCSTEFEPKTYNQKFCSIMCGRQHYERNRTQRTMYDHICEHCDELFRNRVKRSRFCSSVCAGKAQFPYTKRECTVCGTGFKGAKSDQCSQNCRRWAKLYPGRRATPDCLRCGKPHGKKSLNAKFCSYACAAVHGQARREGRDFRKRPPACLTCGGSLKHRTHSAKYCSRSCQALKHHERRSGKMSSAPVEGVQAGMIFERDQWVCHICDESTDPSLRMYGVRDPLMPTIDHIIPIGAEGYPGHVWENLATAHLVCNTKKSNVPTDSDWDLYERLVLQRMLDNVALVQACG